MLDLPQCDLQAVGDDQVHGLADPVHVLLDACLRKHSQPAGQSLSRAASRLIVSCDGPEANEANRKAVDPA